MVASLEMLSGRSKEYAKAAQAVAEGGDDATAKPIPITSEESATADSDLEAVLAM